MLSYSTFVYLFADAEPIIASERSIAPSGNISAQATTLASLLSTIIPIVSQTILDNPPITGSRVLPPGAEAGTTTLASSPKAQSAAITDSAPEAQTSMSSPKEAAAATSSRAEPVSTSEVQTSGPLLKNAEAATTQLYGAGMMQTPGSDLLPTFTDELLPGFMDDFYANLQRCLNLVLKSPKAPLTALSTILNRSIENIRDLGAFEQADALRQLVLVFEQDVRELRNIKLGSLATLIEEEIQALSARREEQKIKAQEQIDTLSCQLDDLKANNEDLNNDLELTQAKTEAAAQDIARANEMINKAQLMLAHAQGILDKSEPEHNAGTARIKELKAESATLQAQQLRVSEELKEAEAERLTALSLAEDQLKQEAVAKATSRQRQMITRLENKLTMYLQRRLA